MRKGLSTVKSSSPIVKLARRCNPISFYSILVKARKISKCCNT